MKDYKLPEVLPKLLNEKNINQEYLAYKMKICRQTIYKWINYKTIPNAINLINMSEILGVSINYLIYGEK